MKKTKVLILVLILVLISCKKQEWKGVYSGIEELTSITSSDTINTAFQQTATIDFSGSICHYNSSTLIWEFDRKQKTKTGYFEEKTGVKFEVEFFEDSLVATFESTDQNNTTRIFRGKK